MRKFRFYKLAFFALAITSVMPFFAMGKRDNSPFSKGNWAPENAKRLEKLISDNANTGAYAVFDWDYTCILQDTQQSIFRYQIDNLRFKMTPEEFHNAVRSGIPEKTFVKPYTNTDGEPLSIKELGNDIDEDYKFIYENYSGFKGTKSLEEIKVCEEYKDFRGKFAFLYLAINATFPTDISYPWNVHMYTGMTTEEAEKLLEDAVDEALKSPLEYYTIESSDILKRSAGKVTLAKYKRGLRTQQGTQNLMRALRDNGIEVYVCSAGFEDAIRVFASNPKYGYNVKPENVIGMRFEKDNNARYLTEYKKGYPQTQKKGKTEAIASEIAPKHNGKGPVLVGIDSNGDYDMATDFSDTQLVLVMNRVRKSSDRVSTLAKQAVEEKGKIDAKVILQGRDENKGIFIPYQGSILLSEKEMKVLSDK